MKQLLITIAALVLVGCGEAEADRALLKATKEGNIKRLNEMGITDIDKIYEANELASGENVVFAGSGITDGLLFDGVKFEKDCTRTSSLVISTLDQTARFTNTVHIKDGAQSISLK